MFVRRVAGFASLLVMTLAALPAAGQTSSSVPAVETAGTGAPGQPKGHLVLNGGGGEAEPFWPRIFELAGGKGAAIVILPTASGARRDRAGVRRGAKGTRGDGDAGDRAADAGGCVSPRVPRRDRGGEGDLFQRRATSRRSPRRSSARRPRRRSARSTTTAACSPGARPGSPA